MPVFSKDGRHVLYIHVPKTGGTSIENFLTANGYRRAYLDRGGPASLNPIRLCSPQHMHGKILRAVFDLDAFDAVFMTVRDPYRRFQSEYAARNRDPAKRPIDMWAKQALRKYRASPFAFDNHLRPQSAFHVPGAAVFRQEEGYGPEWRDHMSDLLGDRLTGEPARDNANRDRAGYDPAAHHPSPDVWARFQALYDPDYEAFGYERRAQAANGHGDGEGP